ECEDIMLTQRKEPATRETAIRESGVARRESAVARRDTARRDSALRDAGTALKDASPAVRDSGTSAPRLIYAKWRGVCKCGRGFTAGEQIEFDPRSRQKRCRVCIQNRHSSQQYANGRVVDFDSYRGIVMRLKQIADLPRPLAAHTKDEYWKL